MKGVWYARPRAAVCLAFAVLAVSAALIARESAGERKTGGLKSYAIVQRWYGMDARELERTVAVPLEDALSALPGARDIATTSEYGMVRASVRFESNRADAYEAVRSAAQTVYESLPRAAQRPEIHSAEDGRAPVWIAAVTASSDLDRLLEREIKSAIERVEGVGEVELAGTGMPEIAVLVDEEKAAAAGIGTVDVARFLSQNDGIFPAGMVRDDDGECAAVIDARYPSIERLGKAVIRGASSSAVLMNAVAKTTERSRKSETRSRVNGKEAAVISVTASSDADIASLSRSLAAAVRREEKRLSSFNVEFRVLSDRGAEREASFKAVLNAAVQGALVVASAAALLASLASFSVKLVSALAVPFVLVVSAAALAALGFPLDRLSLAGLAAGLGAAADAVILTVERIGTVADPRERLLRMRRLAPPMTAGAATTLATLIPIASMDSSIPGSAALACAVGLTTVTALAVSFLILPSLVGRVISRPNEETTARFALPVLRSARRTRRAACRTLALNAAFCARHPRAVFAVSAAVTAAAALALAAAGTDAGAEAEGDAVYVHLEFERGATMESVDSRLAAWGSAAAGIQGVLNAQTGAKPGSGTALVTFDPKKTNRRDLSDALRSLPLPGGFVFLPEPTDRDRLWELVVSGDDDRVCRGLAREDAAALSSAPFVKDVVLNFKDGPERLLLVPDRDKFAQTGLSFAAVADTVRRGVYGPPAYKRLDGSGETDVRVSALRSAETSPADLERMPVRTRSGIAFLGGVMTRRLESDVSRVVRRDRRPVASLTIRTNPMDPRRAEKAALAAIGKVDLPPLYAVEFDREAVDAARRVSETVLLLIAAVVLSYLALAAVTESFTAPLVALATVPPSLAVPALAACAFAGSVSAASASAFVAVSGMAVNAAVLTVDERRSAGSFLPAASTRGLYRLTRSRAASLAATCAVTVAGSLPLLFLSDAGNAAARELAFVGALGVGASFAASLTIVPAFAAAFPRMFDTNHSSLPASDPSAAPDGPIEPVPNRE